MTKATPAFEPRVCEYIFGDEGGKGSAVPIHAVRGMDGLASVELHARQRAWAEANTFTGRAKSFLALPDENGSIGAILFGLGTNDQAEPCGPPDLLLGELPRHLPAGRYRLAGDWRNVELAAVAWGLGSYKFDTYQSQKSSAGALLELPGNADGDRIRRTVNAVWLGRDLINTPANDMGPDELEHAVCAIARRHAASLQVISGDELVEQNFPLIHAVGRASPRAPRLIDLTWGRDSAPRVTIVGKGVCFDTGGLDIKPSSAMLLMKKDMGGAAAAIALADLVMGLKLDVRLRLLVPAVENSVAGDAFRPGDIIRSRAGLSVEIGNTDAEGRLVLADALALGDEDQPELMMTFATLTGAARVALGPDLPPFYLDDDELAAQIVATGMAIGDPVWRMPFWTDYGRSLDSANADLNNVSDGPFAGSVTAALFLKRFVKQAKHYAHFDIYGWRPSQRALGPKGGEPHATRAMFDIIRQIAAKGGADA
ncbi:MAG: leucyl aminopeptidase family protein [Alphaproteobacteria bacterium]|nr:leucyl aminopeptidase family protein [Alphaproteobacteria bacterium]